MAKKPKDVAVLHGHHVVTGPELRATLIPHDERVNPIRLRRRIVHAVVLVLHLALIASGVTVALAIMNGQVTLPTGERATEEAPTVCPTATYDYVPPEQVTLNIFNGTSRAGLAGSVADEFRARNFAVAAVANQQTGYRGVAAVISGAAGQPAAFTVQRHLPGSDYFQDGRTDGSVDVILVNGYEALTPPELVDQTPGQLSCPRESRRIVDDSKWPVMPPAA